MYKVKVENQLTNALRMSYLNVMVNSMVSPLYNMLESASTNGAAQRQNRSLRVWYEVSFSIQSYQNYSRERH